ncbi:hypothetical protein TBR22_A06470 [Luteitalea sp. TBR-22]|uniref:hypothetical protein n=1 Tax=Luteitalea sp. TBR-22 TaxID=2802971 RepID=UPI001AF60DD7|nr:hypothetical protein [Luteitalea sp. TBR-22]BCS31446.1 hypothetical protein TBR22_A06470 [Luteitalea sp. TBR-22]
MIRDTADLSQLEREFELEMDDDPTGGLEMELEADDGELDDGAAPTSYEAGDDATEGFAERFHELSQGSYESEHELDQDVNRLVAEMEQEFFFKNIGARLRRAGKGLLRKGLKAAAGRIPALKALQSVTQLARGNLKGMLASLAKAGLASAIPGGAVALPALQALGFEAETGADDREAWRTYGEVSREAFEHLAEHLHEQADTPAEASRLAAAALQAGLANAQARTRRHRRRRSGAGATGGGTRVIRLRRGERLVVTVE